jgi:hypothetical protein
MTDVATYAGSFFQSRILAIPMVGDMSATRERTAEAPFEGSPT